jgi:hypothetical protein
MAMQVAVHSIQATRPEALQWRFVYGMLLPLFVMGEGVQRAFSHFSVDEDEPAQFRGAWFSDARSHASIATSYALMARSMLKSSERRNRPERLS